MSYINPESIGFRDNSMLDAGERLRVSNSYPLFDNTNEYGINTRDWVGTTSGDGALTFNYDQAVRVLTATTGSVVRQTRVNWRNFPGRATQLYLSFEIGPKVSGAVKRIGYYDAGNGVFLEVNGTDVRFVKRTDITGTASDANYATQANWNRDKLDGTGPSGQTLNLGSFQTMFIDVLYSTVGRVRVGFVFNGKRVIAHEFFSGNNGLGSTWRTPHLPIRAELTAVGTTAQLKLRGTSLQVEAGTGDFTRGWLNTGSTSAPAATTTTLRPILSVRAKALLNGYPNRAWLVPYDFGFLTKSNDIRWVILVGATLTGASWVSPAADAAGEYDVSATSFTGGFQVVSGFSPAGLGGASGASYEAIIDKFPTSVDSLTGGQTIYTLAAQSLTGTADVFAYINWREIY